MIEIKNNQNLIVIYFASFAYESLFRIVYPGIKMTEEPFSLHTFSHCKYLRPNYDQIAAYGRTTTAIPWFQPLAGCQSIFIVYIGIKEKYRIRC